MKTHRLTIVIGLTQALAWTIGRRQSPILSGRLGAALLLPLQLFGSAGYATLLRRLALPQMLTQAAAPTLVAPLVAASWRGTC